MRVRVYRGARRVLGRVLGACDGLQGDGGRLGQGRGQRDRGGQCARLDMERETVRQSGGVIMHNRRTDFL